MTLKSFVYYVIGIITWLLFNNFSVGSYGTLVLMDFTARYNLNDAFISSLYVMWVFIYYLATFFFSICFLYLYIKHGPVNYLIFTYTLVALILYLCYIIELFDLLTLNFNLPTLLVSDLGVNVLLTNMLNRYHPFIFYISVVNVLTYSYIFITLNTRIINYQLLNHKNETLLYSNFWTYALNFTALYLGAWWANQEGNWGGWWASDSSEMLGMLILTLSLFFLHLKLVSVDYIRYSYWNTIFLTTILIFYYFLQINYELVSHNFGSRFFFFFNSNLWSLTLIIVCLFFSQKVLRNHYNFTRTLLAHPHQRFVKRSKLYTSLCSLLFIFLCFWLALSVSPLVDTFILAYRHEWGSVFSEVYRFVQTAFVLSLLFAFVNISKYWLFCTGLMLWFNTPSLVVFVLHNFRFLNLTKRVHWLLICFFCVNLYTCSLLFLYPNRLSGMTSFVVCDNLYSSHNLVYVCDGCWFNQFTLLTDKTSKFFNTQTLLTHCNSFEYDKLNLMFNNSVMFNCLYLSVNYSPLFSFIEFSEDYILNIIILITFLKTVSLKIYNHYHFFY